jgi:hypothetical protein|tara:strand:+ start:20870 stop:21838 length:969 start_codon:yes stop_codon:yes gene_type:complete
MSDDNKRVFEVDGESFAVLRPSVETLRRGSEVRSKTFNEALQRGDLLRDQLDGELRKRDLWNDDREEEYQKARQSIIDGEFKLSKGGIKLQAARDVALNMGDSRNRMVEMLSSRSELDSNTCEGKADAARFNLLFAESLVYEETGERYFPKGLDEYLERTDNAITTRGATEFYYLVSGTENLDDALPENKFLKEYDLVNDEGRLIDSKGRLIAKGGQHIDEFGNFIEWQNDEDYIYVDSGGREVERESGDFKVEFSPFLDDEGDEVSVPTTDEGKSEEEEVPETEEAEPKKSTPKKKATRRKSPAKAQTEKNKEVKSKEEPS